jgi:hypothetical protein
MIKRLLAVGCLALAGLGIHSAGAHPHHDGQAVLPYGVEKVTTFEMGGQSYVVWNTHIRGLFGGELIEIRRPTGHLAGQWWSGNGWCFTPSVYDNQGCWPQGRYMDIFGRELTNYRNRFNPIDTGTHDSVVSTVFCDHYTQLEYTVSGDTSGICGHEDGLPLPSWAE